MRRTSFPQLCIPTSPWSKVAMCSRSNTFQRMLKEDQESKGLQEHSVHWHCSRVLGYNSQPMLAVTVLLFREICVLRSMTIGLQVKGSFS